MSDYMLETALLGVSVLIIAIVLLQSNKASDGSQMLTGGNEGLFAERKERGFELFVSRLTLFLGVAFFVISFIIWIS